MSEDKKTPDTEAPDTETDESAGTADSEPVANSGEHSQKDATLSEDGSVSKDTTVSQEAGGAAPGDDGIIDAVVIDEAPAPEPDPAPELGKRTASNRSGSFAAKAGWGLSALLAAFAAGVYFAPQFDAGLKSLGLKEGERASSMAGAVDLAPLEAGLLDLKESFARQQEILAQHEAALQEAGTERGEIRGDLSLLAASGASGDPSTDPQALAAVQADIERLTADLARLSTLASEDDPSVSQLTGALALARAETNQLKTRLKSVEDAMKAVEAGALEASPRGRLVLALGRLKDRAVSGQPFLSQLDALRPDLALLPAIDQQMIGADLAVLQANAGGLTPYEALVAEFDDIASAALREQQKAEGSFLAGLFTARRTDAGATGLDATLLRAERRLLARDVAGAIETLASLSGEALEATAAWRSRASGYVESSRAFDRLIDRVANSALAVPAPERSTDTSTDYSTGNSTGNNP